MDTIIRGWIAEILERRAELLAIAIRRRAKFEGWLKFELAAHAQRNGAESVSVEAAYTDETTDLCRSDLTFLFDGLQYDVELKTPNTNWRLDGVLNTTRPITQNIAEIAKDGRKLLGCDGRGIIAIVMFPVPSRDRRWVKYLQHIATELNTIVCAASYQPVRRTSRRRKYRRCCDLLLCCPATQIGRLGAYPQRLARSQTGTVRPRVLHRNVSTSPNNVSTSPNDAKGRRVMVFRRASAA